MSITNEDSDETFCSELSEDIISDSENKKCARNKFEYLRDSQELAYINNDHRSKVSENQLKPKKLNVENTNKRQKHFRKCSQNYKRNLYFESRKISRKRILKTRFLDDIINSNIAVNIKDKTNYIQGIRRRLMYINNKVVEYLLGRNEIPLHVVNGFLDEVLRFSTVPTEDIEVIQVCEKLKLQLNALLTEMRENNDNSINCVSISYSNECSAIDTEFTSDSHTSDYDSLTNSPKSHSEKKIRRINNTKCIIQKVSKTTKGKILKPSNLTTQSTKMLYSVNTNNKNLNAYSGSTIKEIDMLNEMECVSESIANIQLKSNVIVNNNTEVIPKNSKEQLPINFITAQKAELRVLDQQIIEVVEKDISMEQQNQSCNNKTYSEIESSANDVSAISISSETITLGESRITESTPLSVPSLSNNDASYLSGYESDTDIFEEPVVSVNVENQVLLDPQLNKEVRQHNIVNFNSSTYEKDSRCMPSIKHKNLDYITLTPLTETINLNNEITNPNCARKSSPAVSNTATQATFEKDSNKIYSRASSLKKKSNSNVSNNLKHTNVKKLNNTENTIITESLNVKEHNNCNINSNELNSKQKRIPLELISQTQEKNVSNIVNIDEPSNNATSTHLPSNIYQAADKDTLHNEQLNIVDQNIDINDSNNRGDSVKLNLLNQLNLNFEDIKIISQQLQIPINRLTLFVNKQKIAKTLNKIDQSHVRAAESIQEEIQSDLWRSPTEEVMLNSRFEKSTDEIDSYCTQIMYNAHTVPLDETANCTVSNERELLNNYMSLRSIILKESLPKRNTNNDIQKASSQAPCIEYPSTEFNNRDIEEPLLYSQELFSQLSYERDNKTIIDPNLSDQTDINYLFQNSNDKTIYFSPTTFHKEQSNYEKLNQNQQLLSNTEYTNKNFITETEWSQTVCSTNIDYSEATFNTSSPMTCSLRKDLANSDHSVFSNSGLTITSTYSPELYSSNNARNINSYDYPIDLFFPSASNSPLF